MTLIEARNNLEKITYDVTAWEELDFYNKEFIRHHAATFLKVKLEMGDPIVSTFSQSLDLDKDIRNGKIDKTKIDFELTKMKITIFFDDLIEYLEKNNLPDINLSDLFKI